MAEIIPMIENNNYNIATTTEPERTYKTPIYTRIASQRYYVKNKETIQEKRRDYLREYMRVNGKKYYDKHADKILAKQRDIYRKKKEAAAVEAHIVSLVF